MSTISTVPLDLAKIVERRKLRLVILDCPYDTMQDQLTRDLFGRLALLKIVGYRQEYPYGVLPLDTTDFIGTHILLCEETPEGLQPITASKSITYSRCKIFKTSFPAFHLLDGLNLPDHQQAICKIIDQASRKGEEVAYSASWTVHPTARKDKELKHICRDMGSFFLTRYYDAYQIPHVLAGAVVRFKVNAIKDFVGFTHLSLNGKELDPIDCKFVFNEKVSLHYLHHIKKEAKEWANKYNLLWNNRLVICATDTTKQKKAA